MSHQYVGHKLQRIFELIIIFETQILLVMMEKE